MLKILQQHLLEIIRQQSREPLHLFLKKYFRRHPKLGSRDRRIISSSVYNFYRPGKSLSHLPVEEQLEISNELFTNQELSNPEKKIDFLKLRVAGFDEKKIFPFAGLLSQEIDATEFSNSFLLQPMVWIRIREKHLQEVIEELKNLAVDFIREENSLCMGFSNSTSLTKLISYEKGFFEIQDASSQKTLNNVVANEKEFWWDCCAGSGGKSLLFKEKFSHTRLLISDNRTSILENAKTRLQKSGTKNFEIKHIDLISPDSELQTLNLFDGIIADVPCSGSGTWARTPEMIQRFAEEEISTYARQQKEIISKAIHSLKKGGRLYYITCSVFKAENEEVVSFASDNFLVKCLSSHYIKGYDKRADTLFVAEFAGHY